MDECIEWPKSRNNKGYGMAYDPDTKRTMLAHRMVMEQAGHDIDGKVVMHLCDNPACVHVEHLRVGSQSDNMLDCASKGRLGPRPAPLKLTDEQVAEIRASTDRQVDIAERYGVTQGYVSRIKTRTVRKY